MGWLSGPPAKKQSDLAVIDGSQGIMVVDAFGVGRANNAGTVEPDGSFRNYAVNGYGRNELVYACVRYRAESLPQASLRIYPTGQRSTSSPIDDHRLRKLFEDPNPVTGEFEFFELSSTYKDLAGTCFWYVVNGRDGLPSQIWPLRPDLVGVYPNPRDPAQFVWVYRPDITRPEIAIPVPDAGSPAALRADAYMIRIRYPNPNPDDPGQPYFGQPPLRPAARATSLDNAATDMVDTLLRNNAMPNAIIETEAEITDELHRRLRARWREAFSGTNRGTPAFLQKGMTVKPLAMSLTDLEFPDLREVSEGRICGALGVEPILVGTKLGLTHNAYKDYREARLSFWEESMFSEQRKYLAPVKTRLVPRFNGIGRRPITAAWDNSDVLALKESQQAVWDRASMALARGGITRNDFRTLVGLPTVDGGDVFLTPAGVIAEPGDGSGTGPDPAAAVSASLGVLAAEYGIELSGDELALLRARTGWEG